ncbi:Vomeronasal type-2 receptor 1 [Dissostichus eleginoides]|uniref:Vomeronasal type-2 receptor 1 n=1 Tax=Dissostichus eleginoides TaxID=100907 RepID=A0AAD9CCJ2_DISEL|nr:Vomeronasal type-2 receptor 1 [Dissostichus eleginoides]
MMEMSLIGLILSIALSELKSVLVLNSFGDGVKQAVGLTGDRTAAVLSTNASSVTCKLQGTTRQPAFSMDGDYVIGGVFSIHSNMHTVKHNYTTMPEPLSCAGSINPRELRFSRAMVFAIKQINNSTELLPGIKLGYEIYDSCASVPVATHVAFQLSGGQDPVFNTGDKCSQSGMVMAVVGESGSTPSISVAHHRPFNIPQWIGSESWVTDRDMLKFSFCAGAIGFGIEKSVIPGLRDFLLDLSPSKVADSPLLTMFWEEAFNCRLCVKLVDSEPLALQSGGDVVIGGLFPLHFVAPKPQNSYHSKPKLTPCKGFDHRAFRWMMTMVFAVEEINRNTSLLPGVKLGYRIMDSCDHDSYPSFLRTVPSDLFQVRGLVQLVTFLNWLWVGTIGTTDDYSQYGIQAFSSQFKKQGGCVAFHLIIPKSPSVTELQEIANKLQSSTAQVVVVFATEGQLLDLFLELAERNVTGIQLVASEAWVTASLLTSPHFHPLLEGTLGFSFPGVMIPDLEEFLLNVRPSPKPGHEFVNMFWEELFGCRLEFRGKGSKERESDTLLQHLKKVNFTNQFEEKVYFDSNGEPVPLYDIINWQKDSKGKIRFVKVGSYDGSALFRQQLQIDHSTIVWTEGQSQRSLIICTIAPQVCLCAGWLLGAPSFPFKNPNYQASTGKYVKLVDSEPLALQSGGDVVIGGLFPLHFVAPKPQNSYHSKPQLTPCSGPVLGKTTFVKGATYENYKGAAEKPSLVQRICTAQQTALF